MQCWVFVWSAMNCLTLRRIAGTLPVWCLPAKRNAPMYLAKQTFQNKTQYYYAICSVEKFDHNKCPKYSYCSIKFDKLIFIGWHRIDPCNASTNIYWTIKSLVRHLLEMILHAIKTTDIWLQFVDIQHPWHLMLANIIILNYSTFWCAYNFVFTGILFAISCSYLNVSTGLATYLWQIQWIWFQEFYVNSLACRFCINRRRSRSTWATLCHLKDVRNLPYAIWYAEKKLHHPFGCYDK